MNENNAELREDNGTLSRKRRTALVTYLAILFAVAFLLVALDMIIENHKLQSSNQALEDSNTELARGLLRKHLGRYIRLSSEDAQ